jgi:hypothetical protein
LPHIAPRELAWRLHFMMGALAYTLAGTDAWRLIAALNPTETGNDRLLLARLAPFLIAGLKAPLPDLSAPGNAAAAPAPGRRVRSRAATNKPGRSAVIPAPGRASRAA